MARPRVRHLALFIAFALHLALCLTAWRHPPYLNSDSATGFLIWDSMKAGAGWSHLISPSPDNLAVDRSEFVAWWSPGQYLVAGPLEYFGLSLGHAIALGCLLAAVAGLLGYWRLFLALEFPPAVAAWSVLAISTNWTMTRPYGDYLGGEVALLAVLPWLILLLRAALRWRGWAWLAAPLIYWLGCMAKLAFSPVGAGLIVGLNLPAAWAKRREPAAAAGILLRCAAWLALGHLLLWDTFLRRGPNPGTSAGGGTHPPLWDAALQLLGRPVSSAFSWGNMIERIFLFPSAPRVSDPLALWPLDAAMALASVALIIAVLRRETVLRPAYAGLVLGVLAAMECFYALTVALNLSTGLDDRMFKPLGILLVPGLVAWVGARHRAWAGRLVAAAGAASMLYGAVAAVNRLHTIDRIANVGRQGITQHVVSPAGLAELHRLDDTLPTGSIIFVPSPEIALDVRRTRVISTHAVQMTSELLARQRYQGRVPALVIVVNHRMIEQGRAQAILQSFADYNPKAWAATDIGEWSFYRQ